MIIAPFAASITNAVSTLTPRPHSRTKASNARHLPRQNAEAKTSDPDSTQSAEDIQKDCADSREDVRNDSNGGRLTVGLALNAGIAVVYVSSVDAPGPTWFAAWPWVESLPSSSSPSGTSSSAC
jgi:hypothetical protein